MREGRIPGIQIGGRWRIETKVLQRFLGLETDDQFEQVASDRTASPVNVDAGQEIEKLQAENKHLRAIIAQQLLELHELEADKGTSVFRQEVVDKD